MPRNYGYTQGKKGKVVDTDRVLKKLRGRVASLEGDKKVSVAVGYNTSYALKVHEDLTMPHPNGGQAKFLEQPARILKTAIIEMIKDDLKKDMTGNNVYGKVGQHVFAKACVKAGRMLERESRKLVPVDTAFLVSSSFTTLESHS